MAAGRRCYTMRSLSDVLYWVSENAAAVGPVALKERHGGQQAAAFRFGFGECSGAAGGCGWRDSTGHGNGWRVVPAGQRPG